MNDEALSPAGDGDHSGSAASASAINPSQAENKGQRRRRMSGSTSGARGPLEGHVGNLLALSLWLALLWAPLPLGSNRWWAIGLLALWVWLTLAAAAGWAAWRGQWPEMVAAGPGKALPPHLLMAGLAVLPALQILQPDGTADRFQTGVYLLTTLTYLGAALLVMQLCTTAERVKATLLVLVLGALGQAVMAILLFSGHGKYSLFFFEFAQGARATGTFPNPDHLAGYMEMGLAAGLGLMFALMSQKEVITQSGKTTDPAWLKNLRHLLNFVMSTKMILRLGLVVMVIALVMTHSRMGNAAFFASLIVMGAALAAQSPKMRKTALWLVVSVVVIDVVVIGQWVGLEKVMDRLQQTELSTAGETGQPAATTLTVPPYSLAEETLGERLRAPLLTLNLIAERPWTGFGGGSFFTVFPPYKTPDMPWFWNHAHNDYVEVAADLGLPGLALLLALGIWTLIRIWPRMKDSASSLERGVAVAAGVALTALALHSLVDFNLHIPANALTLTVLVCLAWAPGLTAPSRGARGTRRASGGPKRTTDLGVEPPADTADNLRQQPGIEQPGTE